MAVGAGNAAGLLVVAAGDLTRQCLDTGALLVPYSAMLIAERAPSLHEVLRELPPEGFAILGGTLIATDASRRMSRTTL